MTEMNAPAKDSLDGLGALYLQEAWWLSNSMCEKCEWIFKMSVAPETGDIIQVDPEIHSAIIAMIGSAANLKKLITFLPQRSRNESAGQFSIRRRRCDLLRSTLDGVVLDELLNHKLRNTLEHFDEYLDGSVYDQVRGLISSPIAAYNVVISSWEVINPRPYPVRVYVSDERKFYNMRWTVDVGKLYSEALAVRAAVASAIGGSNAQSGGGPGGLLLRLPNRQA
jgi:hypothetical protein